MTSWRMNMGDLMSLCLTPAAAAAAAAIAAAPAGEVRVSSTTIELWIGISGRLMKLTSGLLTDNSSGVGVFLSLSVTGNSIVLLDMLSCSEVLSWTVEVEPESPSSTVRSTMSSGGTEAALTLFKFN